jgi:hypothetical protein
MTRTQLFPFYALAALCLVASAMCGDDNGDSPECTVRADCSDHGDCTDGACDCDWGYEGTHCDGCDALAGYTLDATSGDCVLAGCVDVDLDGYHAHDTSVCPTGEDYCDGDLHNYTENGCANCVDSDGDGYGQLCDLGTDCDDADETIHDGCS